MRSLLVLVGFVALGCIGFVFGQSQNYGVTINGPQCVPVGSDVTYTVYFPGSLYFPPTWSVNEGQILSESSFYVGPNTWAYTATIRWQSNASQNGTVYFNAVMLNPSAPTREPPEYIPEEYDNYIGLLSVSRLAFSSQYVVNVFNSSTATIDKNYLGLICAPGNGLTGALKFYNTINQPLQYPYISLTPPLGTADLLYTFSWVNDAFESSPRANLTIRPHTPPSIAESGTNANGGTHTLTLSPAPVGAAIKWFKDGAEILGENAATLTGVRLGGVYKAQLDLSPLNSPATISTTGAVLFSNEITIAPPTLPLAASLTTGTNAVVQNQFLVKGIKQIALTDSRPLTELTQTVQYLDGLSRPVSQAAVMNTVNAKDVVAVSVYDNEGRQPKSYLPFTAPTTLGQLIANGTTTQAAFYNAPPVGVAGVTATGIAYSETRFDKSPLSLPLEQAMPGESWKLGSAQAARSLARANTATEMVPQLTYTTATQILASPGNYADNELMVAVAGDAQKRNPTLLYTDKAGRKVAERTLATSGLPVPAGQLRAGFETTVNQAIGTLFDRAKYLNALEMAKFSWAFPASDPAGAYAFYQNQTTPTGYAHFERIVNGAYTQLTTGTAAGIATATGTAWLNAALAYAPALESLPAFAAADWNETLYAYDELGRISVTLQPAGVLAWRTGATLASVLADYAYRYTYDARGRLVEKKVPGKDWEQVVYDRTDRLIMTQTGVQRPSNFWNYVEYDGLGRPVRSKRVKREEFTTPPAQSQSPNGPIQSVVDQGQTEYLINGYTRAQWQDLVDQQALTVPLYETRAPGGYTDVAFPFGGELLTETYYDDYDYDRNGTPDVTYTAHADFPGVVLRLRPTGAVTCTRAVLMDAPDGNGPANPAAPTWVRTVYFYDDLGRVVQTQETLPTGYTVTTWRAYSFTGQLLLERTQQNLSSYVTVAASKRYSYDHAGRRTRLEAKPEVVGGTAANYSELARYAYNELGQLLQKSLGVQQGNPAAGQSIDYRYHLRGWLASINALTGAEQTVSGAQHDGITAADLFAEEYSYDTPAPDGTPARYDGRLAWLRYRDAAQPNAHPHYAYRYDPLGRLTEAQYSEWIIPGSIYANHDAYSERGMTYDANGNLLTLRRKYQDKWVDALNLTYAQDKLRSVTDAGTQHAEFAADFRTGSYAGTDAMTYDADGYTTTDAYRGVSLTYTHQHLPVEIRKDASTSVRFVYDATGRRVRRVRQQGGSTLTEELTGAFKISGSSFYFQHEEGQLTGTQSEVTNGAFFNGFEYHLRDRVGSVRAVFDASSTLAYTHYYPLGLKNGNSKIYIPGDLQGWAYEFQGSEPLDDVLPSFYFNDHINRLADIQLARWNGIDPMAENNFWQSTYSYMDGDPINTRDPYGLDGEDAEERRKKKRNITQEAASDGGGSWWDFGWGFISTTYIDNTGSVIDVVNDGSLDIVLMDDALIELWRRTGVWVKSEGSVVGSTDRWDKYKPGDAIEDIDVNLAGVALILVGELNLGAQKETTAGRAIGKGVDFLARLNKAFAILQGLLILDRLLSNTETKTQEQADDDKDKKLTNDEINLLKAKLKQDGYGEKSIEKLKVPPRGNSAGQFDLFKKKNGDIVVKPQNGKGQGEPTGYNIYDL